MEKVENAVELLSESIALSKRNTAAALMPVIFIVCTLILFILGWYAHIVFFQTGRSLVGISIILLILSMNLRAILAAANAWVIANTVWEETPKFYVGLSRAFKAYWALTFYSIITLFVGLATKHLRHNKDTIMARPIRKIFKNIPEEMWDSIAHLTLPAIIIGGEDFHKSLSEIKKAIDYIPEVKYSNLGYDYLNTLLVTASLVISLILWLAIQSPIITFGFFILAVMILFAVESFVKSTYFSVLYIWIGEQVERKKKKKALEFRLPAILENTVHLSK